MEVQFFSSGVDNWCYELVPVQKAAYSVGNLAAMRVAPTAVWMAVLMASSWVAEKVARMAGLMVVSMAVSTAVQSV